MCCYFTQFLWWYRRFQQLVRCATVPGSDQTHRPVVFSSFYDRCFFRRDSVGALAAAYASFELYDFHIVVHVNSLFRFCIRSGFCFTGDKARGVRPHRT
jgi:hypothetical protein